MSEKAKPPHKEITEEVIEEIQQWARSPATLRAIKDSEQVALKVNKELEKARQVDPRSLREPISE